jgi:GDPmannose 4,6-dehydratase
LKALITGINGQDGSYLAEILLAKGYDVHGIIRRSSLPNTARIDKTFDPDSNAKIHYGDLSQGIDELLYEIQPDEIYNLGAMSHVKISFDIPVYTGDVVGLASARILEAIRRMKLKCKYYQASSSEMFGTTPPPQSETSPFNPVSPYGCAKLYSYHMTRLYRMGYGIHACNGILFNHESERRGINFVTRKITRGASRIKLGLQESITLGNLNALRDWGHARDYMEAVHLIMQQPVADDWVVSTGFTHSVKEFLVDVFEYLGLDWHKHVIVSDDYKRPNEVPALLGDSTKIRSIGWKPKISYKELIKLMVDSDLREAEHELQ